MYKDNCVICNAEVIWWSTFDGPVICYECWDFGFKIRSDIERVHKLIKLIKEHPEAYRVPGEISEELLKRLDKIDYLEKLQKEE
jgi:hypothetical protein